MPTDSSKRIRQNFFFALLIMVSVGFLGLVTDFLLALFWAAVLATIFHRTYRRLRISFKGRSNVAAVLTTVIILFVVVIPITLITIALINQSIGLVEQVQSGEINVNQPLDYIQKNIPVVENWLGQIGVDTANLREDLSNFAITAGQTIANRALSYGSNVVAFTVQFFLMLYLLFFFLRDGISIIRKIISVVPMGDKREWQLVKRFASVSRATLKGTMIVAIVQGSLGGLAFWILGIEGALFWGVMMTILSLLPMGGSGIVWIPTAIILFTQGAYAKAIILVIIGAVFIGLIDNLLRPLLVGRDTQMPDYLVLLSTLGGITWFGLSGFVLGPVIAALFITCWEMVGEDYGGKAA